MKSLEKYLSKGKIQTLKGLGFLDDIKSALEEEYKKGHNDGLKHSLKVTSYGK